VILPPYVSLYNATFNATYNVVNATFNFSSSVNFTLFFGGIIFMKVLNETNATVLSGFVNQTDKDYCKSTKLPPLSTGQEAAIGGFVTITAVMLAIGVAHKIYEIRKKRIKNKAKKASKYDDVKPTSSVSKY